MKSFKEKVLEFYNLTEEEYKEMSKEVSLEDLTDSLKCDKITECVEFIKSRIKDGVKTLIYGDYDCDGIVSTAILFLTLSTPNFKPGFYIPFRETDGYGLTKANVDRFYNLGYKLLILVDNGITLVDEIEYANSKGMEVIVIDHHIKGDTLPNAKFILHPIYSNFSDVNISAGCLSFVFSTVYLNKIDDYILSIASISTISDLMELKGYNRTIVKLGIKFINQYRYPNIIRLIPGLNGRDIDEDDLSLTLIPKINAIGRIVDDNKLFDIVKYLINYKNEDFINKTSCWIEEINNRRRLLIGELENKLNNIDDTKNSICLVTENVKEGLIGILSSRLMNEYNKPTVVFVKEAKDPSLYKGSVRSKNGFDVSQMLNEFSDILKTYGGHKNAGGLSIKKDNFADFMNRFEEFSLNNPFIDDDKYIEITTDDVCFENYKFLRTLSPYGNGFKKPDFKLENYNTDLLSYSKSQEHIITKIGMNSSLVYFNYDKNLLNYRYVDFYGRFAINEFHGYTTIQFVVNKFTKK